LQWSEEVFECEEFLSIFISGEHHTTVAVGYELLNPFYFYRGKYSSDGVHKQEEFISDSTREEVSKHLVLSKITSGTSYALESSHEKIFTSDKVI
jgi:hypothetical protein